jgi:hypothetical protein
MTMTTKNPIYRLNGHKVGRRRFLQGAALA